MVYSLKKWLSGLFSLILNINKSDNIKTNEYEKSCSNNRCDIRNR